MPPQDRWRAHLRAMLLALLAADEAADPSPERRPPNSSMLATGARRSALFRVTHDQVRSELRWLAEQGLVSVVDDEAGLMVLARLTERGREVASGEATAHGVLVIGV